MQLHEGLQHLDVEVVAAGGESDVMRTESWTLDIPAGGFTLVAQVCVWRRFPQLPKLVVSAPRGDGEGASGGPAEGKPLKASRATAAFVCGSVFARRVDGCCQVAVAAPLILRYTPRRAGAFLSRCGMHK